MLRLGSSAWRLRRGAAAVSLTCLLVLPARAEPPSKPARAEASRALREPIRLTAGTGSELMGVPSPNGRSLYFVSDAEGTLDIMLQSPIQSSPVPLSHGFGDAAWPQIAPDGQHIAYISFERDATGDACVRGIGEREGEEEHCWSSPGSAEQVVLWWDAGSLAVLSRQGLHGDFRLLRQPLDEQPASVLLERNMVGLALSPERRWLAYIPLDKTTREVGITFSQKTAVGIALQRFEPPAPGARPGAAPRAPAAPVLYVPPLPGVTGSVTFASGGEHLLFTQFLNDTNRDGAIDGDDNAVVFRVPFDAAAREPIDAAHEPEQLTSGRWDCHYPAPSSRALIVSCSHMGSLDVYALPLDGAVPSGWDDARLAGEIAVARDLWTKLLLWARRLALAPNEEAKRAMVREMIALHLELGEYESTIYYAERRLGDAETQRWGHVVAELARHRSADLALVRGQTSAAYVDRERARAQALRGALPGAPADVATLLRLVVSEIEDDIGEKAAALATFREIPLAALTAPLLAPLVARGAERLYRLRADRQSLLGVYRTLAGLEVLGVPGRLEYAQRYLRELARGQTRQTYADALRAARAQSAEASELGLLLHAEELLLALDAAPTPTQASDATHTSPAARSEQNAREEAVREPLYTLYTQNPDRERRRALVLAILRAAAKAGSELLQYQFVTSWASSLRREDPERKNAEALYELVVLDRGYGEVRQGALSEGRGYFYAATVATDSLEAHVGFIEARLAEGGPKAESDLDAIYAKRFARDPDSPVYAFVRAYRIARTLPRQSDAGEHEGAVKRAIELLEQVDEQLPKQAQVHQLWGFVLQQQARRAGSSAAAADANRQYELALALAQDDERLRARLLFRLGTLQASLGNHGVALRYLEQRDELPYVLPLEELGQRLAIAESARHMGDGPRARQQMLAAAQLLEQKPELGAFQPLVLDRLALSLTVAGDAAAARQRYEALASVLSAPPGTAPLNRLKAEIGLAANALEGGDARRALGALDQADQLLTHTDELEPEPEVVWSRRLADEYAYTSLQYHALVAGLRARAEQDLGDDTKALAALRQRVRLLGERLDESGIDEDRLELAQAHRELARLLLRTQDPTGAARSLERGLELSDEFDTNTGSQLNDTGLGLLGDYAELHLYADVPLASLRRNLPEELRQSYQALCKFRNPRWSKSRYLFKTYLTEIQLQEPPATGGSRAAR